MKKVLSMLIISSILSISNNSEAKNISNTNWSISFSTPNGFNAKETTQGYAIYEKSNRGMIIMIPHRISDVEELKQMISTGQGINDDKVNISPISEFENLGKNGFSGDFSGTVNQTEANAKVIGLVSPYNNKGVIIVSIEQSEGYTGKYSKIALDISKNLKFQKSKVNYNQAISNIKKVLVGKKLSYQNNTFNSSQNGSVSVNEKEEFYFCSDKSFSGSRISYSSVSGGGMSSSSGSTEPFEISGTWDIKYEMGDVLLVLNSNDGNVYKTRINYQNNKLSIEGRKYSISKGICQ
jgi:hypothetical protein